MKPTIEFVEDDKGFKVAFENVPQVIGTAAVTALKKAGEYIKQAGAADIAAAGFSTRWQKAISARTYPAQGASLSPALYAFHRIPYADVFEQGTRVVGSPLLWLPLPTAAKYAGGRRPSPRVLAQRGHKLVSIKRTGNQQPLLAVETINSFGKKVREPVFFGVTTVDMPKKFHFRQVCAQAVARLPDYYAAAVKHD
jgi:hypothetical protein